MVNIDLNLPENWLKDEYRENDFISHRIKEIWAIEMDMLCKVKDICDKHNIKWWIDAGTLLGAVRHKGFIPWDDDIDIVMFPEDYDKFNKVAIKELSEPYFLQNDFTDSILCCHTKIRRSDTTAILKHDENSNMPFNQGIFIDIFPLDFVPTNENLYKKYIDYLAQMKREMLFAKSRYWLYERENVKLLNRIKDLRNEYEDARRWYYNSGSNAVANLSLPSLTPEIRKYTEEFENTIYLDFEMLNLPAPGGYDTILSRLYGDYMTPVKGKSMHGEVIFNVSKSYKESNLIDLNNLWENPFKK